MTVNSVKKPSNGRAWLIWGAISLALGIIGILTYVLVGPNTPQEGDAQDDALWQSLTIIGAAVFTGVGLVLLVMGILKRRRRDVT